MISKIVTAPKYFPITICQVLIGRAINSSIVFPEYSPEKIRIVNTGVNTISKKAMSLKVISIVAVPVLKTLYIKKYPVPTRKDDIKKYAIGDRK